MNCNLKVLLEARGFIRIFQIIIAICTLSTILTFEIEATVNCYHTIRSFKNGFPFRFKEKICTKEYHPDVGIFVSIDYALYSQIFVVFGFVSILYCILMLCVYILFDGIYKTKPVIPKADFILTTILIICWLFASAQWSDVGNGIMNVLNDVALRDKCRGCDVTTCTFVQLKLSILFAHLNFFIWVPELWFLFNQTNWLENRGRSVFNPSSWLHKPEIEAVKAVEPTINM